MLIFANGSEYGRMRLRGWDGRVSMSRRSGSCPHEPGREGSGSSFDPSTSSGQAKLTNRNPENKDPRQ